jgi:hypothetical protein
MIALIMPIGLLAARRTWRIGAPRESKRPGVPLILSLTLEQL